MSKIKMLTAAQIDTKIASIHTSGTKLQTDMHQCAVSILNHIAVHRDTRAFVVFVGKMVQAMPEMSRVNSLKAWFETFGPVKFNEDGTVTYVKDKATKLGDAMAKPFWKIAGVEGKPYQAINVDKAIEDLVKKLRKDALETGVDHTVTIAALVKAKAVQQPNLTGAGSAGSVDPLTL